MPKSRFVSAARLMPMIVYLAVAFVVLLVADGLAPSARLRQLLVLGWLVLFPLGGWLVWRRG